MLEIKINRAIDRQKEVLIPWVRDLMTVSYRSDWNLISDEMRFVRDTRSIEAIKTQIRYISSMNTNFAKRSLWNQIGEKVVEKIDELKTVSYQIAEELSCDAHDIHYRLVTELIGIIHLENRIRARG